MSGRRDWRVRLEGLEAQELRDGWVVHVARGYNERRRGLAGLDELPRGHALHILRCPTVHTVGMRFALDLVWLDGDGAVVRVDRDVRPWRVKGCRRARTVVEVAAGGADDLLAAGLGAEG